MKTAQVLTMQICQNANFGKSYKAPHAYRGTPPKPHFPRKSRVGKPFGLFRV